EALLIPLGYEVNTARNGMEALEKVNETPPDIILLDIIMPKMDGFEVARRLKEDEETKIIPIVMVTALHGVEDRVKALEAGANDFLTKPVDKTELKARVSSLLQVKAYYDYMLNYQEELSRSNEELEQFAYVTSHDLREPLRMMTSFAQALDKRYKDKLDQTADEYIQFIVDGANRMQTLIDDILTYSRVTTRTSPFEPVEMEKILRDTQVNLKVAAEEAKAKITHDPLPVIGADYSQMGQVMQNLIGNAIKFIEGESPAIHISARQEGEKWIFSVKDNGIGIDPELFDRMFDLFKRLHPQDKYPGTGVGLAVTKKIVQRHGGQIWVESQPGEGSTFYFSIPIEPKSEQDGE
ncbi:MAG: ATP-binding protein, partial [Dehalococcoidales bacterium]